MQYYSYSEDTKEYTGYDNAQLDPLETEIQGQDVYLLPANATFIAPPEHKDGFAIVLNGADWEYFEDNRGKKYWLQGDTWQSEPREMKELGTMPENALFEKPKQTIEELKQQKAIEAEMLLNKNLTALSDYPTVESASFEVQEREAAAYLADPEIAKNEIPTITGIATGSQVELAVLAQKIVDNAKDFAPLRGLYLGRHKRVRDLLNKAATIEELEAVDVAAIFDEEI